MKHLYTLLVLVFTYICAIAQCPDGYTIDGVERAVNGNFDSGNSGFTTQYTYIANGAGQTELNPEGKYSVHTNANDLHTNFQACTDPIGTGNHMIANGSPTADQEVWTQSITVTANTLYYFVCDLSSVHATNPAQLQFSVNSVLLGSVITASTTTCRWDQFYATWNSGASTTATISIVNKNTVASGNDFAIDNISFVPCKVVLPITLSDFKVFQTLNDSISIVWTTESEQNNDYFTIERSIDGIHFQNIGIVKSKLSNSNSSLSYIFYDTNPNNKTLYYRLKQTDFDGTSKHFKIIPFQYKSQISTAFSVYPNPTKGIIQLEYFGDTSEIESISILTSNGEKIYTSTVLKSSINLANMPRGNYFVIVQLYSKDVIQKTIVLE